MIYRRSDTALDETSVITPISFLGRGRVRTLRGRMALSRIGFLDTLFPSETSADTYATAPAGSGFNWNSLIEGATELATAYTQAKAQQDIIELNLQRAQQGLAPIPASAVAPQVNVGVAPDTQRTIMVVGLGAAGILAAAYAFGVIGKGRSRGKRRR